MLGRDTRLENEAQATHYMFSRVHRVIVGWFHECVGRNSVKRINFLILIAAGRFSFQGARDGGGWERGYRKTLYFKSVHRPLNV